MILQWFGKEGGGYGDIIMPLLFAQNRGEIHETDVHLIMRWDHARNQKNSPSEIVEYIYTRFGFPNVTLLHFYNKQEAFEDINLYLKRTEYLPYQMISYFPFQKTESEYDVVCSPVNNLMSFETYKFGNAMWKQGMPNDKWQELIDKPNTLHIDYRTPIEEAINILSKCRMFIGYHGSCTWLAKIVGVPMYIPSSKPKLTKYCFPWSDVSYDTSLDLLERARRHQKLFIKNNQQRLLKTKRSW